MWKYTFLLLAFFLSLAHAGMGISLPSINASPNSMSAVADAPTKKELRELGNITESKAKASQEAPHFKKKTAKRTVLSTATCRIYDDKVYEIGEAGYNDCVEKMKSEKGPRTIK